MVTSLRNFRRNDSGVSLVEGLIAFPLVLLAFVTFIEFGYAMFQWNQTAKALQLGGRFVVVSSPLAADMSALTADYPTDEGGPTPTTPVSVSCGAGTTPCIDEAINRLVFGTDGVCSTSFAGSRPGMCDFNRHIRPENVRITYQRSGLGYVGRPDGPVVTVTVEIRGLTFRFFLIGALLGLDRISVPAQPVTFTGEDMNSCQDECS